ncbi:hypothetical protein BDZ90DRAFT_47837 [Jaminaea rosea]|uniref:Uncharacterized protein n=1 Tax=Jaminaea rosea TaxID=1569628 RepID=A0A316ULM5_9BASI|nr:hypothetical protein BDZ90DRAFT_47837 [Jaminaea rosea]PWN26186.1 hypothetical protein BDZ90DRAFT_47837 [Jaminaea rosea]
MSHLPNFLASSSSRRQAQHPSTSSAASSQHRNAADSRYQFDPLLRSTFGHRSVDLYGSQIDNNQRGSGAYYDDDEEDGEEEEDGRADAQWAQGRSRVPGGGASSSLINASRYGPAAARRGGPELREIEDEEDDDDDEMARDEADLAREEDEQRDWGRGVNVRNFAGGRAGQQHRQGLDDSMLGSAVLGGSGISEGEGEGTDTPSASFTAHPSVRSQTQPAVLDPFLVDDEDEDGAAPTRAPSTANGGRERQRSSQSPARSASKGKGKAQALSAPVRTLSGKGWLAHSLAPGSNKGKGKSRPLRDAYSIYDDEDEGVFSSEDEESEGSEGTDEERDDGVASRSTTMHRPTKMSAASFPRPLGHSLHNGDDGFHKKMPSTSAADGATNTQSGSDSIVIDVPRSYTPTLSSDMQSWAPWSAGNNPPIKQWKDRPALLLWSASLFLTLLLAGGASIGAPTPKVPSTPAIRPSPYYTLTRSTPLLVLLCALSLGMATVQLAFLRNLDRLGGAKVLKFSLVATPTALTLGWVWAFAGSFFFDDEQWSGGGWSTTGLRTLSLIPLLLAIFFSRVLYMKRGHLARSLSVLSLAARIVHAHPTLLLLSLLHIVAFLVVSLPFGTIFMRLFLLGHFAHGKGANDDEWITDGRARVLAWATLATWIWTWAALRGIMRVTVASVVSHWYFYGPPSEEMTDEEQDAGGGEAALSSGGRKLKRGAQEQADEGDEDDATERGSSTSSEVLGLGESLPGAMSDVPGGYKDPTHPHDSSEDAQLSHRNPTASDLVRASFLRATGPSLGTVLLSALLLAFSRLLVLVSFLARTLASILSSPNIPAFLHPLAHVAYLLSGAGGVIKGVSDYTLVYTGITGADFWRSSRRCSRLVVRRGARGVVEGLLIGTVLSLLTVSLSLLAALAGFLFSAHQLHVPADAPLVGLLCGVVPYWTLRLAADVLANGADALYLCYAIDEGTPQTDRGESGGTGGEDVGESQMEARQALRGGGGGQSGKVLPI